MEVNEYETSPLDADVLLPPRKRLLAGLKRQSSESPSQSSIENSSPAPLSDLDIRLQNLLTFYKSGPRMSPEELARASGSAAVTAAKVARAARAAAEEKAAAAVKAVEAAKAALRQAVSFSTETGNGDGQWKKNKMKKHVPVELLYKEQQSGRNCGTDEEIARNLHRAINSSPRISKHSPRHKKRPKPSLQDESMNVPNGTVTGDGKSESPRAADDMQEDANSEESYEESYVAKHSSKSDQVEENRAEADSQHSKETMTESSDGMQNIVRKRGRVKQKKLSLSLCSFKDRVNPKDGPNQISLDPTRPVSDKSAAGTIPVSPIEPHASKRVPIDPSPTWKRQEFKAAPVH